MARFNPGLELRLDDRGPCNAANGYGVYRFSESLSKTRRLVVGVPWLRLEGRSLCTWKRSPRTIVDPDRQPDWVKWDHFPRK